jgi:hypothetical protein
MADDPVEALERQVRQLTREMADVTRQVEHEQKMRGFLEDRVHHKMSRAEVLRWCWALIPLIVGATLLISLVATRVPAR